MDIFIVPVLRQILIEKLTVLVFLLYVYSSYFCI